MDNFNLQGYIASGKLHANSKTLTEAKKQGYDDREDESLGARKGAEKGKKQSMKARRDDSYGKFGKRDAEKKGKNKINKEGIELDESALAIAAGVASKKFVDDNEDKFEFIPDLETGYIDANDNSYNVDELASIFLDIGQDIPRGTHNQKYKGEGGTYIL